MNCITCDWPHPFVCVVQTHTRIQRSRRIGTNPSRLLAAFRALTIPAREKVSQGGAVVYVFQFLFNTPLRHAPTNLLIIDISTFQLKFSIESTSVQLCPAEVALKTFSWGIFLTFRLSNNRLSKLSFRKDLAVVGNKCR